MKQTRLVLAGLIIFSAVSTSVARISDNRFIPFFQRTYITIEDRYSHFGAYLIGITAHHSVDQDQNEDGLFSFYGNYDQGVEAKAMVQAGYPNPLKTEWQEAVIPWNVYGKLQGQGIELAWQQQLTDHWSIGADTVFMRVNSWQNFVLNQEKVSGIKLQPNDVVELDDTRRCMNQQLGICSDAARDAGIGDIDLYARVGKVWDHYLKFRTIIAGFRFGTLIPSAPRRDWRYPSWVPLGGDGDHHWGVYGSVDAEFEIKEDMRFGFFTRLNKRFARTYRRRVPLLSEPIIYGAAIVPMRVDPGFTFILSPYFSLENIRDGLGLRAFYTMSIHTHDTFAYRGTNPDCAPNICSLQESSAWGTDYFSLNVFYDFGKVNILRNSSPILTFTWDIPRAVLVAKNAPNTQKVALGVEVAF
jgi:hypothetical protein